MIQPAVQLPFPTRDSALVAMLALTRWKAGQHLLRPEALLDGGLDAVRIIRLPVRVIITVVRIIVAIRIIVASSSSSSSSSTVSTASAICSRIRGRRLNRGDGGWP